METTYDENAMKIIETTTKNFGILHKLSKVAADFEKNYSKFETSFLCIKCYQIALLLQNNDL